jgi:hypothetical protein
MLFGHFFENTHAGPWQEGRKEHQFMHSKPFGEDGPDEAR